jgi:sugar lactone lactonase YvrE
MLRRSGLVSFVIILIVLAGCTTGCAPGPARRQPPAATRTTPRPTATTTPPRALRPAPQRYTTRLILHQGHPDDLALDAQGRLLVSDVQAGTVSRVEADGSVTLLLSGLASPEGLVALADGTLVIAEQGPNRVLALAPGARAPQVLWTLPGTPSTAPCKHGVDGIALDATTNTLIVPDSPSGTLYRLSLDGQSLVQIASGFTRPVGAAVDAQGNIYVADECGGAVWRVPPGGAPQRIGGFSMPDDVAFDPQGNLLVTDLAGPVHALIRLNVTTGQREVLAQSGLVEPQGLVVDARGDIYLADEAGQRIIELLPA